MSQLSPWLLTCRHTFEATLTAELAHLAVPNADARPVAPGLVSVHLAPDLRILDCNPVYALQILPNALEIRAPSIRSLAVPMAAAIADHLDRTPGDWDLHLLVLGQLKGNPTPPLRRRADLLVAAVLDHLKATARWALRRRQVGGRALAVLAQGLLLSEEQLWLSVVPVRPLFLGATWPATLPAGLATVTDDPAAPASSFRKLAEAFACLGTWPQAGQTAVDLGAAPGGWTRVLAQHGARVTAVDRAPLAPHLLTGGAVTAVVGDAFAFQPPLAVDWLVADIVAFPPRVAELLTLWLGPRWCRHFVVQMKFRGEPDWAALAAARQVATAAGYHVLARHFFNDKNEVTLLGSQRASQGE